MTIPTSVPGVDSGLLNPRDTWAESAAWDVRAQNLSAQFVANFEQFDVSSGITEAGPQV
jgi:phosphoenolpyruvate carboxykinase (ATP)